MRRVNLHLLRVDTAADEVSFGGAIKLRRVATRARATVRTRNVDLAFGGATQQLEGDLVVDFHRRTDTALGRLLLLLAPVQRALAAKRARLALPFRGHVTTP